LCVGGGVGSNTQVGYIQYLKKNSGADQKRYSYYHEKVLIPFYNKYRKELLEYDSESGMICPDEFTGAAYCDGDVPQVKAVIAAAELFTGNRINVIKQNPARSGTEQAADLSKVFKLLKEITYLIIPSMM
jgi:hypothetical protein